MKWSARFIDVAAALGEPIGELERWVGERLRETTANARPRRIAKVHDQPGQLGVRPAAARQIGCQDDPNQSHGSGIDPVQRRLKAGSGLGESSEAPGEEGHRQNSRGYDRNAASLPLRPC
jgi:hypothetical protein